ncbi:MAG: hypothetical protein LC118_14570 [Dehalococcoidia bacterium]|nr:hypothetical protein [Dehalococcoidia bacterium]
MERAIDPPATTAARPLRSLASAARLAVGAGFAVAAVYNTVNGIADYTAYHDFAADSWLPGYAEAWANLVVPVLPMALVLLVLFEVTVAALVLASGREVRLGLAAATVFVLVLVPANLETVANIPLAAILIALTLPRHEWSLWKWVRATLRPQGG